MKEKLKNLWISFLFRQLDSFGSDVEEEDKEIVRWLATSAQDIGCIRYIQMRERAILADMVIDGLANTPRDSFIRKAGQRFENQAFFRRVRIARQKFEAKKKIKEEQLNN